MTGGRAKGSMNGATAYHRRNRLCPRPVPHRLVGRQGRAAVHRRRGSRAVVYALSLAVYCTSWTYYGSVGLASSHGLDFLPIYIGPILVIGLGSAFVGRIANLARAQNLTTVADFVSARYGKSQARRRGRRADRARRLGALCRPAAQGGVDDAADRRRFARRAAADAGQAVGPVLAGDRADARSLRHRLRHPADQSEGASGRPHPRDRGRVDRQARRLSRRRRLRRLGPERRPLGPHAGRARQSEDRRGRPDAAAARRLGRRPRCSRPSRSSCCRASFTSRWSRTTTGAACARPPGCFRPISC